MKTKFQGKPLRNNSQIGFLEGEFGKRFLAEYNYSVKRYYNNNPELSGLHQGDNQVTGSNPYIVVLVNQVLREEYPGLRTATQADLEMALKDNALPSLPLRGWVDTGLVLGLKGSILNLHFENNLTEQLRKRNIKVQYPSFYNLKDLVLTLDPNSKHGLSLRLRGEGVAPTYAPILDSPHMSVFDSSDIDESTGLPRQVRREGIMKREERTLHTGNYSPSRLYLDKHLNIHANEYFNIYSSGTGLTCTNSNGRIVVVRA